MKTELEFPILRATTTPDHAAYAPDALLNERTGEMVDPTDTPAVRAMCGAVLDAYAYAHHRAEAARLAAEERRTEVIGREWDRLQRELGSDPEWLALQREKVEAEAEAAAILEGLNGALRDRAGDQAISLDAGSALVTWGKARSTWTLARPASWFATPAARSSLARTVDNAAARGLDIVSAVLDWLDPTEKLGELPPVRVTLRQPK